MSDVHIDSEFRALIPPLSADELAGLEANLLHDGCREPLVVWDEEGILLDGHNRKALCDEHGLGYRVCRVSLPDREAAADWIDANQLGRRNLSPEQMSLLRGRRYNRTKRQGERTDLTSGQIVHKSTTADKLATEQGVAARTIRRDGAFASAVHKLGLHSEAAEGLSVPRQAVIEAARELDADETRREALREALTKPHVANNSGENEWYTPEDYTRRATEVLGTIDLDPASSAEANAVVGAVRYFTIEDDGLTKLWSGRVWMNPPYAAALVQRFADKLIGHYRAGDVTEAVVMVNNATETRWFQAMLGAASAVCFLAGRVRFWSPDRPSLAPLQGQAVVYFGPRPERFGEVFGDVGGVCHVQA